MESIDVKIEEPYHDGDGEVEGHHGAQDGHHVVRLHELDIALVFGNLPLALNVLPGVDGYDPHHTRQAPGTGDHQQRLENM